MKSLNRRIVSAALLAACAPFAAQAQAPAPNWASKPIRIVVPFAPGGTTDIVARMIGQRLGPALGTTVVIDNKPGANGIMGSEVVARAPADGHTLVIVAPGHASNVTLYKKLPYDTLTDFEPILLLLTQPSVLVVHPSVPVTSTAELIRRAKAQPGMVSYASGGNGSSQHLAAAMFADMAGIELVHVPYKGSAPAEADLLGGQVNMMLASMVSALPQVKSGRLRALAVSSERRSPAAPDLPTVAEAGVPGYSAVAWAGLLAPKGTPPQTLAALNAAVTKIMNEPEVKEKLAGLGADFSPNTPKGFDQFIRSEITRWGEVIRRSNLKVD
ncbi:tripartite tricarboxylate transporter substrate binding protein [Caenimonas sp. SL110]|uniref:tripartite tricarboxylate transporter substrate binding protein n=1 Tax=Caenimonas sp. SL110 TaxID=1450524 RepID=UPI000654A299|nr:tripartite tricarboxylate transporter substrate binding protein [Caenimonas sp. SL110]